MCMYIILFFIFNLIQDYIYIYMLLQYLIFKYKISHYLLFRTVHTMIDTCHLKMKQCPTRRRVYYYPKTKLVEARSGGFRN